MDKSSHLIICDGCGLQASPEHIAERVARLEIATRFRPIHISTLIVVLAPIAGMENDFYGPPASRSFFDAIMNSADLSGTPSDGAAKLTEFQRRGLYVAFLSECPIATDASSVDAAIKRLAPNLIRRIRFNYRPKQIALVGSDVFPLAEFLNAAALGPLVKLEMGERRSAAETGIPASNHEGSHSSAADGAGS